MSLESVVQTATVSEKGWIVIPRAIRERFGIKKGDKISIVAIGGTIRLIPVSPGDPVERGYGLLGTGGPSLTEALLANRRWELEQEERDLRPPRRDGKPLRRRVAEPSEQYGGRSEQ